MAKFGFGWLMGRKGVKIALVSVFLAEKGLLRVMNTKPGRRGTLGISGTSLWVMPKPGRR